MAERNIQVLFIGLGQSRISWYRCILPAMYLGCDWVGLAGYPPKLQFTTGYVKQRTMMPNFLDYHVVVVQQARGRGWFQLIGKLQSRGIKVLYELDDNVHSIRKHADHDFKSDFKREDVREMELCMRAADGMIVSTEFLYRRYRKFNKHVWVCPNGLDMARYRLSPPTERPMVDGRESVTILWSGATGHQRAIAPWLQVVEDLMDRHSHLRFVSVGYPFAEPFRSIFGERAFSIPFTFLETYPAAMLNGDIALAPAGDSGFARAKSALRALEAGALGLPVVADPRLYAEVVRDGETGFLVEAPADAEVALERLIQDGSLRKKMGIAARAHVAESWDMRQMVEHWKRAIVGVLDGPANR